MNRLEAFHAIARSAAHGDLAFPTAAQAALALKRELDKPDAHFADAIKWIEAEPLLAAKVVSLANSAAYNRVGTDVKNLQTAGMRVGFKALRALAARHLARQLAFSGGAHQDKADELWRRGVQVAALSRILAKKFGQDPEDALFAGLIQDLGGFYLISQASSYPGLLDGPLEDWVGYGERLIGKSVLKAIGVPGDILSAVEDAWLGRGSAPPKSIGDALCLANALAPIASPLAPAGHWSRDRQEVQARLDLAGEPLALALANSAEEVASLEAALST